MRARHALIVSVAASALGLAALPVLLLGYSRSATSCSGDSATVDRVTAAIRQIESGGNYRAQSSGSSASGAYQYLDSTWNGYEGFQRAGDAPPSIQDRRASEDVSRILAAHGGSVEAVAVTWYLGHVPAPGSPAWGRVPAPSAGNRLTPRQYVDRFLRVYGEVGQDDATGVRGGESCGSAGGQLVADGAWALWGPSEVIAATADQLMKPHHDYPAWDWSVPTGTPIYAIRGGTVVGTSSHSANCYGASSCVRCGIGVTVIDGDGVEWTYCHGTALHVRSGQQVAAGSLLITSGNSGNSTGPHLHLAIRAEGAARCPQPLLAALVRSEAPPVPKTLPLSVCTT